jgi:hypothetical protein
MRPESCTDADPTIRPPRSATTVRRQAGSSQSGRGGGRSSATTSSDCGGRTFTSGGSVATTGHPASASRHRQAAPPTHPPLRGDPDCPECGRRWFRGHAEGSQRPQRLVDPGDRAHHDGAALEIGPRVIVCQRRSTGRGSWPTSSGARSATAPTTARVCQPRDDSPQPIRPARRCPRGRTPSRGRRRRRPWWTRERSKRSGRMISFPVITVGTLMEVDVVAVVPE